MREIQILDGQKRGSPLRLPTLKKKELDRLSTWPRKGCVTRLHDATNANAVGLLNSWRSLGFKFREFDPKRCSAAQPCTVWRTAVVFHNLY